jgi:hypothetical protein
VNAVRRIDRVDVKVHALHVPAPVVLGHVAESGVDATLDELDRSAARRRGGEEARVTDLSGDGVRPGREKLGDASRVETGLGETERSCIRGSRDNSASC